MILGIVGGGVVGRATARCFVEHHEVRVYDVDPLRRTHCERDAVDLAHLVMVCLPSPQKPNSLECDLSYIEGFFAKHRGMRTNFVLRSTVPIGTTRRLSEQYDLPNLCHSPEFLTARCSMTDVQVPARNIVGVPRMAGEPAYPDGGGKPGADTLLDLYATRFPGVPVQAMTSDESEAVKLVLNSFFAVKVAFFNEAHSLVAGALGLDWNAVMEGVLSDGRIAHAHTKVPGPDGKCGYGGTCLPKDIANLESTFAAHGVLCTMLTAARIRNVEDRKRAGRSEEQP